MTAERPHPRVSRLTGLDTFSCALEILPGDLGARGIEVVPAFHYDLQSRHRFLGILDQPDLYLPH